MVQGPTVPTLPGDGSSPPLLQAARTSGQCQSWEGSPGLLQGLMN